MKVIELTYRSLLADVASQSGFSEIRGSRCDLHWCVNDAPKLEKLLLKCIENGVKPDLDMFPDYLHRLVAGSVEDPVLLRLCRQLLLFGYKAYVQYDKHSEAAAYSQFATTNEQVAEFGRCLARQSPSLLRLASRQVQSVLYRFKERDIVPFHGPGASTTPKGRWANWFPSIDYCYPYSDYMTLYFNQDHIAELPDSPTSDHIKAKLIAVPKDSRGPRLICVHPAESIWIQQGVRCALEKAIASRRSADGPWPCGHVRFDDQTVNGRIALLSSKSRKYATLDMKEASDRLSEPLVQALFGRKYKWFGCCRAQKYWIPGQEFSPDQDDNIHCYAPMGNATTFPVQSLVFWAICCASMQSRGFHQPNSVFVFGDDILVPTDQAPSVMEDLESFGLKVNKEKSFINSHFRESCGVDAFKGSNVTPVRWKCSPDAEYLSELQSLSDIALRLRKAGFEEAAVTTYKSLRAKLSRRGRELFITNNANHGGIAEYSRLASSAWTRAFWHKDLQKFVSPVIRSQAIEAKAPISGWNQVLESLTSLRRTGRSNVPDRSGSRRTKLIRGWTDIM